MSTLEKKCEYEMDSIETLVGFLAMNFGIALVISFQPLSLFMVDRGCGIRKWI